MSTYCPTLPAGFETLLTTLARKERLASLLKEGGVPEQRLARKLERCGRESPCNSGACAVCTREFRIWLLGEALPVIEVGGPRASSSNPGHTKYWTSASIIPAGYRCAPGELDGLELATKVKSLATAISRSSLASGVVIGGFDVSLNTTSDVAPFWQLHLYLLISGKPEVVKKGVKEAFKPEPTADRPYRCTLVYSPRGALTYAYKAVFSRRSSYRWERRTFTRHLPLSPEQQRELALFLDQGDTGGRLILSGLKRNGSKLVRLR
jgi:hypothetical protein